MARLGCDEFVVLLPAVDGVDEASAVAARLLGAMGAGYRSAERAVTVSASIGVRVAVDGDRDPESLLTAADAAMYRAKRGGKNHDHYAIAS